MSATESPKESTLIPPAGSTELEKLRALIADDGFAATFQTMGRYRAALLQTARLLERSSSNVNLSRANLEGLAKALLTPRAIVRDSQGWLDHPSLPICDEGVPFDQLLGVFGLETHFRGMDGDAPQEVEDRYFEHGESGCADWMPTTPDGDGWHMLSIYETEDGPYALFARERPPEQHERGSKVITPNAEPFVTDHSVDVDKMVAKQTKPKGTAFKYRDGEIRDADGRQLMLLMASNCTKKFRDHAGRALVGILNDQELQEPSLPSD